jgi:hypothetical protein
MSERSEMSIDPDNGRNGCAPPSMRRRLSPYEMAVGYFVVLDRRIQIKWPMRTGHVASLPHQRSGSSPPHSGLRRESPASAHSEVTNPHREVLPPRQEETTTMIDRQTLFVFYHEMEAHQ